MEQGRVHAAILEMCRIILGRPMADHQQLSAEIVRGPRHPGANPRDPTGWLGRVPVGLLTLWDDLHLETRAAVCLCAANTAQSTRHPPPAFTYDPENCAEMAIYHCIKLLVDCPEADQGPAHTVISDYNFEQCFIDDALARLATVGMHNQRDVVVLQAVNGALLAINEIPEPKRLRWSNGMPMNENGGAHMIDPITGLPYTLREMADGPVTMFWPPFLSEEHANWPDVCAQYKEAVANATQAG